MYANKNRRSGRIGNIKKKIIFFKSVCKLWQCVMPLYKFGLWQQAFSHICPGLCSYVNLKPYQINIFKTRVIWSRHVSKKSNDVIIHHHLIKLSGYFNGNYNMQYLYCLTFTGFRSTRLYVSSCTGQTVTFSTLYTTSSVVFTMITCRWAIFTIISNLTP